MSSLHTAARRGDDDTARDCLAEGADVNAWSVRSFTPLMLAVRNRHASTVKLLLGAGADVHLAHPNGRTALHFAASTGCLPIVALLVENGANLDVRSNIGCTAMLEAAEFNHEDVVVFLKENGADAQCRCREGLTADDWLAQGGVFGRVKKLCPNLEKQAGAHAAETVRKMMAEGLSPAEYAAKHGRRILVYGYGADRFADSEMERWAHGLAEILFTPGMLEQCEEQYLQGEELEDARRCRARLARHIARRDRKRATFTG
jgi:ankyrin repeat protein